jgi:hypothetical protein
MNTCLKNESVNLCTIDNNNNNISHHVVAVSDSVGGQQNHYILGGGEFTIPQTDVPFRLLFRLE